MIFRIYLLTIVIKKVLQINKKENKTDDTTWD